jgi:hypothetical protein
MSNTIELLTLVADVVAQALASLEAHILTDLDDVIVEENSNDMPRELKSPMLHTLESVAQSLRERVMARYIKHCMDNWANHYTIPMLIACLERNKYNRT